MYCNFQITFITLSNDITEIIPSIIDINFVAILPNCWLNMLFSFIERFFHLQSNKIPTRLRCQIHFNSNLVSNNTSMPTNLQCPLSPLTKDHCFLAATNQWFLSTLTAHSDSDPISSCESRLDLVDCCIFLLCSIWLIVYKIIVFLLFSFLLFFFPAKEHYVILAFFFFC